MCGGSGQRHCRQHWRSARNAGIEGFYGEGAEITESTYSHMQFVINLFVFCFCLDDTVMGKIAKTASTTKAQTTALTRELNLFMIIISCIAVLFAIVCFFLWLGWLNPHHAAYMNTPNMIITYVLMSSSLSSSSSSSSSSPVPLHLPPRARLLYMCCDRLCSVIVALVPEGLPISLASAMTIIARRMAKQHVFVKQLICVETLGSVDMIAFDKVSCCSLPILIFL